MTLPVLSQRQLTLATLERQSLLERAPLSVEAAIHQTLGLQSQLARPPFLGLWSRLANFDPQSLKAAIHGKAVVRVTAMRGSLHLMTREDYIALRPCFQPGLEAAAQSVLKQRKANLDIEQWTSFGDGHFRPEPRTMTSLRDGALEKEPGIDERAVGYVVRMHIPLVQAPNQSQWSYPGVPNFQHAAPYLGETIPTQAQGPGPLIKRYLAAFGPSSLADIQSFLGLKGLAGAIEALGDDLRPYTGPGGLGLFDLASATLPDPETPCPPRFIPDFDNLLIARSDERFLDRAHRKAVFKPGLRVLPTLLIDGRVIGTWSTAYKAKVATLSLALFAPLPSAVREAVEAEGHGLLRLLHGKAKTLQIDISQA